MKLAVKQWIVLVFAICNMSFSGAIAHASPIGVAAVVNETVITTHDVVERAKLLIATGSGKNTPELQQRAAASALRMLIDETLQLEEAKRLSILVTDEEIETAIGSLEKSRNKETGSLRSFLRQNNIDESTIINQVRAQISWNKVVSQRLRRNIIISEDEITRAEFSKANAPGAPHYHIAALSVPIRGDEEKAANLAQDLLADLQSGTAFTTVAHKVAGNTNVIVQPSAWVPEKAFEPAISAALRELQPGQTTKPLRSRDSYQVILYRDKRNIRPLDPATELILKDTLFPLTPDSDAAIFPKMLSAANGIRQDSSVCNELQPDSLPEELKPLVQSKFLFGRLEKLSPQMVPLVSTLNVGETSEPIPTPEGLRMVTLCEKIEPGVSSTGRSSMRAKLFNEKTDLEAVKHLRNLRRDAFIEIRSPVGDNISS